MNTTDARTALRCAIDRALEEVLLQGAVPWELDEALEAAGWARGVCLTLDREGLDDGLARRRTHGTGALIVLDRMVAEGRLGPKVGVGFYRYPGGGGAVIDPLIDDLIAEEAHFAGRTRHPLSEADGAARFMQALKTLSHDFPKAGYRRLMSELYSAPV